MTCGTVRASGTVSNSCSNHRRKLNGREEENPVLRGRGLHIAAYFTVENSSYLNLMFIIIDKTMFLVYNYLH